MSAECTARVYEDSVKLILVATGLFRTICSRRPFCIDVRAHVQNTRERDTVV